LFAVVISEFIPCDSLSLGTVLGEGEFGSVYKGTYQDPDGTVVMAHHISFS
jgi:hypothetical protein